MRCYGLITIINSVDGGEATFSGTMKVSVMAKVGFFGITLDNENVVGKVVAVKDGPVRAIIQISASIVALKTPFLTMVMGLEISDSYLNFSISTAVPEAAKAINCDLRLLITKRVQKKRNSV